MNRIDMITKVFIFFVILTSSIFSSPLSEVEQDQIIFKGKQLIYNARLQEALNYFDSLRVRYPNLPMTHFYKGYIKLLIYSQDMKNDSLLASMKNDFNRTIKAIEMIKGHRENKELQYYLGLSFGAIGAYYAVDKNYLKGYWFGRKAKNYLVKAKELDSTYYDVYLGLGIYHYYVGLMPSVLKIFANILGFSGSKEKGLYEIALCAQNGKHFRVEAKFLHALLTYFMQNEMTNSIKTIEELGMKFPENPVVPLLLGYHHRRNGRPGISLKYYVQISDSVIEELPQIYQMKYYNMVVSYFLLNQYDTSIKILDNHLEPYRFQMTEYYQSALNYYKGIIYLIRGKSEEALTLLQKILDKKHTSYWYFSAQPFVKYPINETFRNIMRYRNNVFCNDYQNESILRKQIEEYYSSHPSDFWYMLYLDTRAQAEYSHGNYTNAEKQFLQLIKEMEEYSKAEYFQKWVYVHYARVLAKLNKYDEAEQFLEKAKSIDDDYIKFICEREKFILNKAKHGENPS